MGSGSATTRSLRGIYGTMPSTGTGRVGVSAGNQIDFIALPSYDRKTIAPNAPDVWLGEQNESSQATFGYNALDQLTAAGPISAVSYNADGDQESITGPSRGTVTLGFDGRHLVTSQTASSITTTWLIDGEGRVTKQVKDGPGTPTVIHRYVAPGDGPAWEENASGGVTASFVGGAGGLLATYAGGAPTFPVYNGHGDVIQTRDSNGSLVDAYIYDENGIPILAAKPTRYGYVGSEQKDREEDSNLIRMGERMYDPLIGRFTSWDPVDGGDWNAYSYAGQNPINNVDLDGTKYVEYDPQPVPKGHKNPPASKRKPTKGKSAAKKKGALSWGLTIGSWVAAGAAVVATGGTATLLWGAGALVLGAAGEATNPGPCRRTRITNNVVWSSAGFVSSAKAGRAFKAWRGAMYGLAAEGTGPMC